MSNKKYNFNTFQSLANDILSPENKVVVSFLSDKKNRTSICVVTLLDKNDKEIFCITHVHGTQQYELETPDYSTKLSESQKEILYKKARARDTADKANIDIKSIRFSKTKQFTQGKKR